MTSAHCDAQRVESLRPIAAELRAGGATTARGRVLVHLLGVGAAVALAAGPLGLAGDLLATVLMAGLFLHADAMQHEAAHHHVARTAGGNHVVGLLASAPMLVPFSLYRAFHHAHHAHAARAGDPEGVHEPSDRWPWPIEGARTARFWVRQWVASLQTVAGVPPHFVRTGRQCTSVRVDTAITMLVAAALVGGSLVTPTMRWVWLVPFVVYVLVLFPLFHTYEHAGAEARAEAGVSDPVLLTSTLRLPRPLSAALWHATVHTAHHAFPSVPWRRLPELQVHLDELLPPELVYESLSDYLRSPQRPSRRVEPASSRRS